MFHHMQMLVWGFSEDKGKGFYCVALSTISLSKLKNHFDFAGTKVWLHESADFIRQLGSDNNLRHLIRLPKLSAVHIVHLAYIVLRFALMT